MCVICVIIYRHTRIAHLPNDAMISGMRMAYRRCNRIGSVIRLWNLRQVENYFYHVLDLFLLRTSIPDQCLLDLERGIFRNAQSMLLTH